MILELKIYIILELGAGWVGWCLQTRINFWGSDWAVGCHSTSWGSAVLFAASFIWSLTSSSSSDVTLLHSERGTMVVMKYPASGLWWSWVQILTFNVWWLFLFLKKKKRQKTQLSYLSICGRAGSSLLWEFFSSCSEQGLLSFFFFFNLLFFKILFNF